MICTGRLNGKCLIVYVDFGYKEELLKCSVLNFEEPHGMISHVTTSVFLLSSVLYAPYGLCAKH